MKKTLCAALALIIALSASACAEKTDDSSAPAESSTASGTARKQNKSSGTTKKAADTEDSSIGKGIALIEINTKNTDSLDFITEPVCGHVAEKIAGWTPGYVMPPEPYYEECTVTVYDKEGAPLTENAAANVKVRGNWTTTYSKKPLRIKFDEKQPMLGLNDGAELKNWVLLAEYKDISMLRDKTALAFSRDILGEDGLYAADADFAEVTVNGEYWGVYLVTEQQQVNSRRVDITKPEDNYEGTDIGYFMEYDGYFYTEDELHSFPLDFNGNAPLTPYDGEGGSRTMTVLSLDGRDFKEDVGVTIKSDIYSQAQRDFIAGYVNNVYNIMYHAAYDGEAWVFDDSFEAISKTDSLTPREAVEKVVNVNSLADMYIISELTCDADLFWSSFYMSADLGEGGDKRLTFQAPWDFDSAMGNKDRCADGTGFYAANIIPDVNGGPGNGGTYESINPWLAMLMYEDWYQDIIREKWTSAYDAGVFENAAAMAEADKTDLHEAFKRNYDRWGNLSFDRPFENELSRAAAKCKTHEMAADQLIEWFNARVAFMNDQWHK